MLHKQWSGSGITLPVCCHQSLEEVVSPTLLRFLLRHHLYSNLIFHSFITTLRPVFLVTLVVSGLCCFNGGPFSEFSHCRTKRMFLGFRTISLLWQQAFQQLKLLLLLFLFPGPVQEAGRHHNSLSKIYVKFFRKRHFSMCLKYVGWCCFFFFLHLVYLD